MVVHKVRAQVKRRVRNVAGEQRPRYDGEILDSDCIVGQIQVVEMPRLGLKQKVIRLIVEKGVGLKVPHPQPFVEPPAPDVEVIPVRYPASVGLEPKAQG